jgi:hypothetical protein
MNTSTNSLSSANPSTNPRWRIARRLLLAMAAVATIIAVFYAVENWRGKRAWDNSRRALESKGEVLDWSAYIPAPVPDEQNFYKAPKMQEWFVREHFGIGESQSPNGPQPFVPAPRQDASPVLADVKVVAPSAPLDSHPADAVLRSGDPAASEQAAKLLRETTGPCLIGSRSCVLLARPLEQIKSLHLVAQTDTEPALKDLSALFPTNTLNNYSRADGYLRVEPVGSHAFCVSLKAPVYGAADYLAWTDPLNADFDLVRKALERPYARIDCDYQQPFGIAIPNFVRIRNVVQTLSQRAQCYLLLGQPEAAWHELSLVHDLSQILLAKPSGKPLTLVGAMINVAVTGLYSGIVQDGLRLHAWREPQLQAIRRQLQQTDLLAAVVEALKEERAASCRTFETTSRRELLKLFDTRGSSSKLALAWMPRGWFFQNMAVGAELQQEVLGSMDLTNRLVRPRQVAEIVRKLSPKSEHRSPYSFLVAIALPNFAKALQTAAANQAQVDQAQLACALETYRFAQGCYPESLDALAPQFVERLPHDLIGGQPLKYRRTDNGGYLLYSIGWDEKDDGGIPGKTKEDGDWVWEIH